MVAPQRFEIRVKPRAKQPGVEKNEQGVLLVKVKEPAEDGCANAAVIEALAQYFQVPRRAVTIVRGLTNRRKFVQITR